MECHCHVWAVSTCNAMSICTSISCSGCLGLNGGKSKLKKYFSHIHFYLNYANIIAWESIHVRKLNKIHTQQKTCCLCCPK